MQNEQKKFLFRRGKATKAIHSYAEAALTKHQRKSGGVAQLGEHLPCKQGVRSSILLISTNSSDFQCLGEFFSDLHTPVCGAEKEIHKSAKNTNESREGMKSF